MQLYRHHITTVNSFSDTLEKVAKISAKDLYSSQVKDEQFKSLKSSTDPYAGMRSFAKGMGVSFAIPLAMGLGMTSPSQMRGQIRDASQRMYNEFYLSHGLQAGGLNKNRADGIAKVINSEANRITVPGQPGGLGAVKETQLSVKNLIQEELLGNKKVNLSKGYKQGWVVNSPTAKQIIGDTSKIPIGANGSKQILDKIRLTGASKDLAHEVFVNSVVKPTSDKVLQTNYSELISGKGSMIDDLGRGRLMEVGKQRVKSLGLKDLNVTKLQSNLLKGRIKGMAKAPLAIGLVGGISAYLANRARQKKYRGLIRDVRRRNA